MRSLETITQSKTLVALALASVMLAACSQKPDNANEVATQQLIEATQKAEEAAARAEAAQKALEQAQAEKAAADAKAAAEAEQAAESKKRAASAARREAAASKPSSSYTEARPAPVCQDCGTVSSITEIKVKGKGSGLGAVAGAIAGVAVGNQIGDGKGTDVAKVVGAIGGAYAGNQAEKYARADIVYDVTVRMDNGGTRTVRVADASSVSSGSRVRVNGANLERM